jgi:hypothetical protein
VLHELVPSSENFQNRDRRTLAEFQISMVYFFSNLLESVHESWLQAIPNHLAAVAQRSRSACRQASIFLASRMQMPPIKDLEIVEDLRWISLDRFKLAELAYYVGAYALKEQIRRIVARDDVAMVRAGIGHEIVREVLESPCEILQHGSAQETMEHAKNAEALLHTVPAVGWDCMRVTASAVLNQESPALWKLRLSCPAELWNQSRTYSASYISANALVLMNLWCEREFKS